MKDEKTDIEKSLLSIVRGFLSEFKTERSLNHLNLNASLQDLGIDSLGRVELFLRIEKKFSVKFEDALMIEANTLNDIANAIQKTNPIQPVILTPFTTPLKETRMDPLSSTTLIEVLSRRVAEDPNRPHLYLQDEHGAEEIIRYGQLLQIATKVATGLSEAGLKPNQTVAIMLPTSAQFFYAFFGVLLAGGIPVPIYPPLRADRIEEYVIREAAILNNSEVRILITFDKVENLSKLLRVFIKSLNTVTTVELLLKAKGHAPKFLPHSQDPALIQYTSGSTSDPKGVLLSHHNLLSNIRSFGSAVHLSPTDVGVSWLPLYHDMGLIGAWLGSLYHAFPLTVLSPLSFLNRPERWLWAIHYHRGTVSGGPNFAYELCVRKIDDSTIQGLDLSSWRLAFNGAEAINPKTIERFSKKFAPFGFREESFYPVYGLAESSVALTFPPLNRIPRIDTIARQSFETKQRAVPASIHDATTLAFVSCGKPLPLHDIRIVDETGQDLNEREIGSLYFTGPSAMLGYYRNDDATKAIHHNGWWDSGDFAYIADGEVFITGRKKDIIIKAGRNLYPQEIEEVTAEVTGVRKGCVIAFGIHDPRWGTEKLVIVAETAEKKSTARNQMISEIIEKMSIVLAISPDEVVLVPPRTIPKTSSGKLQRSLCKKSYIERKLVQRNLPISLQVSKLFLKGVWVTLKHRLKKITQYLYTIYIGILIILLTPFAFGSVTLLPRLAAVRCCRILVKLFLALNLCPIQIQGRENINKATPMIFISNHASYIDALLLMSTLPINAVFVGKSELVKWPLIGRAIKKLGFLTVDRMDFAKNLTDSKHIAEKLQEGLSIVIFPEGTFTHALGLRPFKLGAFKIAVDTKTPLCPIALKGSRPLLQVDQLPLHWASIQIIIGDPLYPLNKEWSEVIRLHALARQEIAKYCGELAIDLITTSLTPKDPSKSPSP